MFLNQLSYDEKRMYIALAKKAAGANGEIASEEKSLISRYCYEMEMSPDYADTVSAERDEIISFFSKSEASHKRIVLFETIAIMYVDGTFDEEEKRFTYSFAKEIGISDEEINKILKIAHEYVKCVANIAEEIL